MNDDTEGSEAGRPGEEQPGAQEPGEARAEEGTGASAGPEESQPATERPEDGGAGGRGRVRRVEIGFAEGDLTVRGSDGPEVVVSGHRGRRGEAYEQAAEEYDGVLRFARVSGGTELIVPREAVVTLREVGGDLRAEDLAELSAGWVGGDAAVADIASVNLGRVEGDFRARSCGTLRVREVGGDVRLDSMREAPELGRIGGDLEAHGGSGLMARESIGGDVQVQGYTQDVTIRGPVGSDLKAEGCPGTLRIGSVGGDLQARLCGAVVVDGSVGGDCDVAEVAGEVELHGPVGGDLSVSLVGGLIVSGAVGGDADLATIARAVRLRTVGGDLSAEMLAGPLTAGNVGGDARFRTVLGALQVSMIGSDVSVQRAMGGVTFTRVGGDADLDTPLAAGAEYQVRAGGDISLRVRGEVNARFVAQTLGGEIRTRLPLAVERGRRRNLVGVLGRGDATVTLHSDGGDISITAVDSNEEDMMSDENVGAGTNAGGSSERTGTRQRNWEGNFAGHKFRLRWDPGATGQTDPEDPDGMGTSRRTFGFEWEHNPEEDRKTADDFDRQMNELREKAEQVARRAAEQAQRYAERAARRARETDWEAIGREVRTAIERAMGDLEGSFGQLRREFDTRRGPGNGGPGAGPRPGGAQRVRIEQDEEGDAFTPGYGAQAGTAPETPPQAPRADTDAQRRAILADLAAGTISLDEAERRLSELH